MANEATVRTILQIRKDNVDFPGLPGAFNATILADVAKGPTPGAVAVSEDGTDIDLSELIEPGLCQIKNLEPASEDNLPYIEYGIWDPGVQRYYPLGEMLPGETYVLRLSRYLGTPFIGTGTGTGTGTSPDITTTLRLKAIGGPATGYVGAFER